MSPRSVRAGVGACLIHVMLLHNAVMLFPKPVTASHIELANKTTDVIKGILDGSCFLDNQTSCPDVVNISCQWQTPEAKVAHAPLCTVWINCSVCSENSSHISCLGNNTCAPHPPDPGKLGCDVTSRIGERDSGILIGALVGGSLMGVAILCVLITRHVYLKRTKSRVVFSGLGGRRSSTVTLSGKSEIRSRRQEVRESRQGKANVNSMRDQMVVKEDSPKRQLPKISSNSETEVTSASDPQDGIVLHIGGSKRAISSSAYEEMTDTVMEARNTDIPGRNDKTGKKDCLKATVEEVPTPGLCDGVSNNSIVKRKQISSSGYEDVPDSLGEHAPGTPKPLPTRVKKDHWKGSVEVVFLTPPEDEHDPESDVN